SAPCGVVLLLRSAAIVTLETYQPGTNDRSVLLRREIQQRPLGLSGVRCHTSTLRPGVDMGQDWQPHNRDRSWCEVRREGQRLCGAERSSLGHLAGISSPGIV